MTSKLCKYLCGTLLEGFDEEQRKFLESGTGGLHTKERCQEAKSKKEAHTRGDKLPYDATYDKEKDNHGNENFDPKIWEEKVKEAQKNLGLEYVDHTAKGQSKVKIFWSDLSPNTEAQYNDFLRENNGKIKTQGAQFQINQEIDGTVFAIALYYEETKQ